MKIIVQLFFVFASALDMSYVEARVYCGDPNANNFTYVGFSCPLKCANVIAVIEQLKISDYHRLLEEDRLARNSHDMTSRIGSLRYQQKGITETEKRNATRRINSVLKNRKILTYLQKEIRNYKILYKINLLNCRKSQKNIQDIFDYEQCIRRSPYEDGFIGRMTKFLNGYAKSNFQFTKSMVSLLLHKIMGTSIDLRQRAVIIPKLVQYLKDAMVRSSNEPTVVHLSPRHCMGVYVPGCYCKEGFLENIGRCVSIKECLQDSNKDMSSYIHRVVIHR